MIQWRMRQLMAEHNIGIGELAELSGIHRTTISRLKNADTVGFIRIDETLNPILNGLNRAYRKRGDKRRLSIEDIFPYREDE